MCLPEKITKRKGKGEGTPQWNVVMLQSPLLYYSILLGFGAHTYVCLVCSSSHWGRHLTVQLIIWELTVLTVKPWVGLTYGDLCLLEKVYQLEA